MLQQAANHVHGQAISQQGVPLRPCHMFRKEELGREAVETRNLVWRQVPQRRRISRPVRHMRSNGVAQPASFASIGNGTHIDASSSCVCGGITHDDIE
jgi:hypothetical protein